MTARWTLRATLCLTMLTLACGESSPSAQRPNEVQVLEPVGREDLWSYGPKELSVAKGTTVTFVNKGKEFHTVTSDDTGRPFDVGIDSGKSGTITFGSAGVFAYHCGLHPQMKGVVRVCDGACG